MGKDLKVLLKISDRFVAEEIQEFLEESNIYSILESDNPVSSVMNIYTGFNPAENISIWVTKNDFPAAITKIKNSEYTDLISGD